ncbi:MAG: hypothetical protein O3A63_05995 [Proteobacteria bacterium]|nr:hypothetical protein [Pseudomonadota bacterium]
MTPSPVELMRRHLAALYKADTQGRLSGLNQWDGGAAPLFHLGRTEHGHRWCFHMDLDTKTIKELNGFCAREPAHFDPAEPPLFHQEYLRVLNLRQPKIWTGPAYWLDTDPSPDQPWQQIDQSHSHLLSGDLTPWIPDLAHRQPFVVSMQQGRAAAVCASVRIHPQAHEAGVETAQNARREGHAMNAVAAWARLVRAQGAVPLYSTAWENTASQATARKLQMRAYGVDYHLSETQPA